MPDEEPAVITATEALKLLRISRNTLYKWVDQGKLKPLPVSPGLQRPGVLKFHRADVERLMPPAEA